LKDDRAADFDDEVERLQELLAGLEGLGDVAAASAARELVQVVIGLHAHGLAELLAIVDEVGSQPADILLPRFLANPIVRGLLLLHDLHPEDLETRARKAVERLRPHLGVHGLRAEVAIEQGVVRVSVAATGQKTERRAALELRREIENAVVEMVPDAAQIVIEGLEVVAEAHEAYVPLSAIGGRSRTLHEVSASDD
jgi:hypothetical protein